jgi:transposase
VILSASDSERLAVIALDRNRQRKHVERARVVLAAAVGGPVQRVAARLGVSRPMVWRWQQRFAEEGVDGLLRDKTREPGKAPLAAETVARVVALTCGEPPSEATHWTGRAMAKAAGISLRSVQRIWEAYQLKPHRVRTFKRSRDPQFAEKRNWRCTEFQLPSCSGRSRHGAPVRAIQKMASNVRRWSRGGRPRSGPLSVTNGSKNAHSLSLSRPRITADRPQEDQRRITPRRVGGIPRGRFVHAA